MSATMSIHIDDVHARAISEEIGWRLRVRLRHEMPANLPHRLQELIDRLAAADHQTAPSIVPSLDDIENIAVSEAPPLQPFVAITSRGNADPGLRAVP